MRKLDLHGLKHEDVNGRVIRFIEENWDCGETVVIVTGYSVAMARIVNGVLKEYNLKSYLPFGGGGALLVDL